MNLSTPRFLNPTVLSARLANKLSHRILQSLSLGPFALQKTVLEKILNRVFDEQIADGDFDFLSARFLRVEIYDIKFVSHFSFNGKAITIHKHARSDASISGELLAFLLLINQQEDPDSLFFQRRLIIDGDTALSLEVKNILDTLELEKLPTAFRKGLAQLGKLLS